MWKLACNWSWICMFYGIVALTLKLNYISFGGGEKGEITHSGDKITQKTYDLFILYFLNYK